jgi:hypothetical protein
MAMSAGKGPATVVSPVGVQEQLQYSATDLVHRRTDAHFKRFKIKTTGRFPLGGISIYDADNLVLYFFINRLCNFFLSSVSSFSSFTWETGRRSHIRSFTSTISLQSFKNRSWLAISSRYFCISGPSFTLLA